jgi:hypothetical protein
MQERYVKPPKSEKQKGDPMKNINLFITGLAIIICILIYQVIDLKQEIKSINFSQPPVVVPNGFSIYGQVTGSSNQDGYWVYKDDEKNIYYFEYDRDTKQIIRTQRSIYDR